MQTENNQPSKPKRVLRTPLTNFEMTESLREWLLSCGVRYVEDLWHGHYHIYKAKQALDSISDEFNAFLNEYNALVEKKLT